ncbi:uncharacterized protein LOC110190199 [Drosophila serrata]|uniref:uncharacterized protein LOC110190199 n=1 Tax=Drosophila serrata TaxID=7274 RepID=UPI000A1CF657|nr:uncharacterized protein LOC110190199 [Drosophila serrata]KAH8360436.1 hypothetical protein KR200_004880 [Drosophila serrata]
MREVFTRSCCALGIVLAVLIPMTGAWRSFKVILTDIDFEANDKIVNLTVDLQNDAGDSKLSVDIKVFEDIEDVQLTVDVGLETDKGNYSTLINRTLNFCKLLKLRNSDPLLRGIYEDLLKHGNLFKECPIRRGTFSLSHYKVDEELLPSFLPEAKFRFGLLITRSKNERILRAVVYGRIDKSKGFDNLKRFSMG